MCTPVVSISFGSEAIRYHHPMSLIALTRAVSPAIARCELTHLSRIPIDFERARVQHEGYEGALRALGCTVRQLPTGPEMPDGVFIEDAAVVVDGLAIITRSGAQSRRSECEGVARALEAYRPLAYIEEPGTLDGGDVLVVGQSISSASRAAPISPRSNRCSGW